MHFSHCSFACCSRSITLPTLSTGADSSTTPSSQSTSRKCEPNDDNASGRLGKRVRAGESVKSEGAVNSSSEGQGRPPTNKSDGEPGRTKRRR